MFVGDLDTFILLPTEEQAYYADNKTTLITNSYNSRKLRAILRKHTYCSRHYCYYDWDRITIANMAYISLYSHYQQDRRVAKGFLNDYKKWKEYHLINVD